MKRMHMFLILGLIVGLLSHLPQNYVSAAQEINFQALMAKRVPVLLEFGRGWCKPCKYMKPVLNDMSRAYAGRAIVTTVDMDANADLVRAFRIRIMPTQVFLAADGKEFLRNEGTLEREHIMQIFAKMGLVPPRAGGGPRAAVPNPVLPKVLDQRLGARR